VFRILLEVVLPIVLPTLIYLGYIRVERRRAAAAGNPNLVPWWVSTPWLVLAGAGVFAAALVLSIVVLRSGDPIHGVYVPAHLENGRLIPGHVEPPAR
jgi:cytochrome c biogenesis protein CcdA